MPWKPARPCRRPGCGNTTLRGDGYCDDCRPYSRGQHEPRGRRLYDTPAWQRLRLMHLRRDPLCKECMRQRAVHVQATEVDHVVLHNNDSDLFYSVGNLQSLCKMHHDQKTARERPRVQGRWQNNKGG